MREINKQRGIFSDKLEVKKEKDYVNHVVDELKDEIVARNNFGMCAPQLGYFARIICLNIEGKVKEFVNPVIRRQDNIRFTIEKSLSLEDENQEYLTLRPQEIDIYYQDKKGTMLGCTLKDIAATTFMQLYDILMGLFIDDLFEKKPDNFNDMTEEERESYIKDYIDRIKANGGEIEKEINENPELKDVKEKLEKYKEASLIDFAEKQALGNNLNRAGRRTLQKILDKSQKGKKK